MLQSALSESNVFGKSVTYVTCRMIITVQLKSRRFQVAPEKLQNKAKGRSLHVSMSTFSAVMELLRGGLNSYELFFIHQRGIR